VARGALPGAGRWPRRPGQRHAITEHLKTGLRSVKIDCTALELCDSTGLSSLLLLRRRTHALGIDLVLANRPALLDRILERTGTFDYLTDTTTGANREEDRG
jgi:anti-anti-sigma factor